MLPAVSLSNRVHWVGVNDTQTDLFEAIWPLPQGISYNSYLVVDEKTALIDAVHEGFFEAHLAQIRSVLGADRAIDYLVVNHMEPDHSGSIVALRKVFPKMQIVGNRKTAGFLETFYGITEGIHLVEDHSTLDLGGSRLTFRLTPMVHWPETMMTFETSGRILFSGDAFGGFGALNKGLFDDQVDLAYFEDEILRYFSNIIGRYGDMVHKAIEKLSDLDIAVVAPTHGPVWRRQPRKIIADYNRWAAQEVEPGVAICYASMYGHTRKMAQTIADELSRQKVEKVKLHDLSHTHLSFAIADIWRFHGLVLGCPTYNTTLLPLMASLLEQLHSLRIKGRCVGVFGTYGWSKGSVKAMQEFAERNYLPLVEPVVEVCCRATEADLARCAQLAQSMAACVGP